MAIEKILDEVGSGIEKGAKSLLKLESANMKLNSLKELVDESGKVNMRKVVELKNSIYKRFPNAKPYKTIINNSKKNIPTNLYEHIRDVVDSALKSPVPKGTTRLQFIQSALLHDIGKTINQDVKTHGKSSLQIIDELGLRDGISDEVYNAIGTHMNTDMLSRTPLEQGLHFADVARGLGYDEAAFRFPQLLYPREEITKVPNLLKDAPIRDLLKYQINPWLKQQGYKTIDLNASEAEIRKELLKRVTEHTSFARGVRDPRKEHGTLEDMRNSENASQGALGNYGEDTPENRLRFSTEYIPKDPTGSGRHMLFSVSFKDGLPIHTKTYISKRLGADPKLLDALYNSTSDNVSNTYSTNSFGNERASASYKVRFPEAGEINLENLADYVNDNEWELYDLRAIENDKTPSGIKEMFELPYRLLTGRSLMKDMEAEGVLKDAPKIQFKTPSRSPEIIPYAKEYVVDDMFAAPSDIFEAPFPPAVKDFAVNYKKPYATPTATNYYKVGSDEAKKIENPWVTNLPDLKAAYNTKDSLLLYLNDIVDKYNITFKDGTKPKFGLTKNGEVLYPKELEKIISTIKRLESTKNRYFNYGDFLELPDGNYSKKYSDKGLRKISKIAKSIAEKKILDVGQLQGSIEPSYDFLATNGEYYGPGGRNNKVVDIPTEIPIFGEDGELITTEKTEPFKDIYESNVKKYFDFDKEIKNLIFNYLQTLKSGTKGISIKDIADRLAWLKKHPEIIAKFMREHGAIPKYDYPNFNANVFYALDMLFPRKIINDRNLTFRRILPHVGYVLGPKGSKRMEIVDELRREDSRTGHRDRGDYAELFGLTRKAIRKDGGKLKLIKKKI